VGHAPSLLHPAIAMSAIRSMNVAVDVLARHEQPEMDRRNEDLENLSFVDAILEARPGAPRGSPGLGTRRTDRGR
jgi:hypothetical protein